MSDTTKATPCANCQRLQARIDELELSQVAQQQLLTAQQQLAQLQATIAQLQQQLAASRKDSSTSCKSPSSDLVKPPKPVRPGGQPGHTGTSARCCPPTVSASPPEEFYLIYLCI